MLKIVDSEELSILRHLHSFPPTPQNRTPLLDVIPLQESPNVLIVMPLLGGIFRPPFQRWDEVIFALHEIMTVRNTICISLTLTQKARESRSCTPTKLHTCMLRAQKRPQRCIFPSRIIGRETISTEDIADKPRAV